MSAREETLRQFEARAEWVKGWWAGNKLLGKKGAVPEVRNLCEDVFEVAAELRAVRADNERRERAAFEAGAWFAYKRNRGTIEAGMASAFREFAASAAPGEDA